MTMNNVVSFSELKIKNTYSFYISDLNKIFFDVDTRKYKNDFFYKRLVSDISRNKSKNDVNELFDIEKINFIETFQNLINKVITKINSIIGDKNTSIFLFDSRNEFGCPMYVTENIDCADLKVLGDKMSQKRYIFKININPNSYLYMHAEEIQIIFYLDEKTKMLSGAFSVNQKVKNITINNQEMYEKVFLNNLYRYFLENEFKKISFTNLLQIFDDIKVIKNNSITSFDSKLKNNWENFIWKKYLNDLNIKDIPKSKYTNDLFNSIFITQIIMLSIYEELKNYLKNSNPGLLLKKININF